MDFLKSALAHGQSALATIDRKMEEAKREDMTEKDVTDQQNGQVIDEGVAEPPSDMTLSDVLASDSVQPEGGACAIEESVDPMTLGRSSTIWGGFFGSSAGDVKGSLNECCQRLQTELEKQQRRVRDLERENNELYREGLKFSQTAGQHEGKVSLLTHKVSELQRMIAGRDERIEELTETNRVMNDMLSQLNDTSAARNVADKKAVEMEERLSILEMERGQLSYERDELEKACQAVRSKYEGEMEEMTTTAAASIALKSQEIEKLKVELQKVSRLQARWHEKVALMELELQSSKLEIEALRSSGGTGQSISDQLKATELESECLTLRRELEESRLSAAKGEKSTDLLREKLIEEHSNQVAKLTAELRRLESVMEDRERQKERELRECESRMEAVVKALEIQLKDTERRSRVQPRLPPTELASISTDQDKLCEKRTGRQMKGVVREDKPKRFPVAINNEEDEVRLFADFHPLPSEIAPATDSMKHIRRLQADLEAVRAERSVFERECNRLAAELEAIRTKPADGR